MRIKHPWNSNYLVHYELRIVIMYIQLQASP